MLSNDDHPGLFTFMVGLIIVVFVGIALSMMVDRKFSFSKRISSLENGVKADEAELDQLKDFHQQCSRKLAELEPKLRMKTDSRQALRYQLAGVDQRRASLTAAREALEKTIYSLGREFSNYRTKYRETTWAAAIGQSLGNLTVRSGREYRQAVISRVTDVGLEIRHEDGIARVQAPELDQDLQDRFQWNDEKRRARLSEENAAHAAIAGAPETTKPVITEAVRPPRRSRDQAHPDSGKLALLRGKVVAWKSRVAQLSSDRSKALSSASYGGQSSVPGSLETRQAKASRLGAELAKAKSELAAAKAALALVAPDDSLLRDDVGRQ